MVGELFDQSSGDIDGVTMSLDEAETLCAPRGSLDATLAERLAGTYGLLGSQISGCFKPAAGLFLFSRARPIKADSLQGLKFRLPEFADVIVEFVEENGKITAVKQIEPSGVRFKEEIGIRVRFNGQCPRPCTREGLSLPAGAVWRR